MKWPLIAAAVLVMAGGALDALRTCEACAPQTVELAKADEESGATVTLVVRGMMKSKSGAT